MLLIGVTWRVAVRRNAPKLEYAVLVTPIVSTDAKTAGLLTVDYGGIRLADPALVEIAITNVGRSSVSDPPIAVSVGEKHKLIPAYLHTTPPGYDELWRLVQEQETKSRISLAHINPGQTARARFLLSGGDPRVVRVSCPMADVDFVSVARTPRRPIWREVAEAARPSDALTFAAGLFLSLAFLAAVLSLLLNRPPSPP